MSRAAARASGAVRMRALALGLPGALRDGFRAGLALAPPTTDVVPPVYAVGMGGSGIGAELARGIVEAETPLSLRVVRSPELPQSIDRRSRVLLVSYSGSTWETLRAFEAAGRAGAFRIAISSGGELADRAEEEGVPLLALPPGLPPRAAVGQLLGGMLGLLDPWFPESNEARLARAADRLGGRLSRIAARRGPAASVAQRVGSRVPFVYAESAFVGLARRWKTQIEENAKRLAFFDEVPELLHNAIVGWDATPRADGRRLALVTIEWSEASATIRRSFDYLDRMARRHGATVARVRLEPDDRLEALITGIAIGDLVSLRLAELRGVDPGPVDAIARLKATLGPGA